MCTAITLKDKLNNYYFGRTMDFSYELSPSIFFSPRNYIWQNSDSSKIINKYCFLGIGQNISKVIFTEGMNEKGISVVALYFPNYTVYDSNNNSQRHKIESLDMVNFLLGNCSNVEEAFMLLKNTCIIGVKDNITNSFAPLHWIIADKSNKCLVVENTQDGLHIISNPIGVLVNHTQYVSFMDLQHLTYYFKTYSNMNICYIKMTGELIRNNKFIELGNLSDLNKFHLLKDI